VYKTFVLLHTLTSSLEVGGRVLREELLIKLRALPVIKRDGPYVLASGKISYTYCNVKEACGYPDILNAMADGIKALLPSDITCVAAPALGGISLAAVIQSRHRLKKCIVRKEHKKRGFAPTLLLAEYVPGPGDVIAVIDDVFSSGGSILGAIEALRPTGARIACAGVAVNRSFWEERNFSVPVNYLFRLDELL